MSTQSPLLKYQACPTCNGNPYSFEGNDVLKCVKCSGKGAIVVAPFDRGNPWTSAGLGDVLPHNEVTIFAEYWKEIGDPNNQHYGTTLQEFIMRVALRSAEHAVAKIKV